MNIDIKKAFFCDLKKSIGIIIEGYIAIFRICMHRKDIYKYFPWFYLFFKQIIQIDFHASENVDGRFLITFINDAWIVFTARL